MPKFALSFSPSIGGASVESVRESLQDLGAEVFNVDYRELSQVPTRDDGTPLSAEERLSHDDALMADTKRFEEELAAAREQAKIALEEADYLIVPGNSAMIHPGLYEERRHDEQVTDLHRSIAELAMIDVAVQQGMPIMGICGGHQLLNVYFGGGLRPLEAEEIEEQSFMNYAPVKIDPDSSLGKAMYAKRASLNDLHARLQVFGAHNEVINKLGGRGTIDRGEAPREDRLRVIAKTDDRHENIEAMESTVGAPIRGTQFHPEIALRGLPKFGGKVFKSADQSKIRNSRGFFESAIQEAEAFKNKKKMLKELKAKFRAGISTPSEFVRNREVTDRPPVPTHGRDLNKPFGLFSLPRILFLPFKRFFDWVVVEPLKRLARNAIARKLVHKKIGRLKTREQRRVAQATKTQQQGNSVAELPNKRHKPKRRNSGVEARTHTSKYLGRKSGTPGRGRA